MYTYVVVSVQSLSCFTEYSQVTCQDLGSANPDQAPDAVTTSFFKGIDDPADGTGALQATVVGGLPAGSYRCCTMSSSSNHQPVIMPVAK